MKTHRNGNEAEILKKQLEDKEKEMKGLKKELYDLKTNMISNSKLDISK
jgi:ribosomal protein L29